MTVSGTVVVRTGPGMLGGPRSDGVLGEGWTKFTGGCCAGGCCAGGCCAGGSCTGGFVTGSGSTFGGVVGLTTGGFGLPTGEGNVGVGVGFSPTGVESTIVVLGPVNPCTCCYLLFHINALCCYLTSITTRRRCSIDEVSSSTCHFERRALVKYWSKHVERRHGSVVISLNFTSASPAGPKSAVASFFT